MEQSIQPAPNDLMIEVGAGAGALSARLAPKVFRLLAIEIDNDLIPALRQTLAASPNAEITGQDILTADLERLIIPHLSLASRLRFCGNLPYNIATAVISKVLDQQLPILDMTFMVQLEVAQRIVAAPGSRDYGFLSVFCQHRCATKMGFRVPPSSFVPRPKVYSAVISLQPRGIPDPELEETFLMVTKAAFAYRRKILRNSLVRHVDLAPLAERLLSMSGIDGNLRAENLSVSDYELLARTWHDIELTGPTHPDGEPF